MPQGGARVPQANPRMPSGGRPLSGGAAVNPLPWTPPGVVARDMARDEAPPFSVDNSQFDQIAKMMFGGAAGTMSAYDAAYNRSVTSSQLRDAGFSQVDAAIRNSLNADLAGVNLDRQVTGVQQSYIPDYMRMLAGQRRIAQGQYDTAVGQLNNASTEAKNLIGVDRRENARLTGESEASESRDMRRMLGEQAASGAIASFGTRDFGGQIRSEGRSERAGLSEGLQRQEIRYNKAMKDIQSGKDKLNWDLKSANLGIEEAETRLKERSKLLNLEAQRHNITAQQLQTRAEERLAQLGLDKAISAGQLVEAANSRDIAKAQAAQQFIQSLAQTQAAFPAQVKANPDSRANPRRYNNVGG